MLISTVDFLGRASSWRDFRWTDRLEALSYEKKRGSREWGAILMTRRGVLQWVPCPGLVKRSEYTWFRRCGVLMIAVHRKPIWPSNIEQGEYRTRSDEQKKEAEGIARCSRIRKNSVAAYFPRIKAPNFLNSCESSYNKLDILLLRNSSREECRMSNKECRRRKEK